MASSVVLIYGTRWISIATPQKKNIVVSKELNIPTMNILRECCDSVNYLKISWDCPNDSLSYVDQKDVGFFQNVLFLMLLFLLASSLSNCVPFWP
jgi:hypothetical protein